MRVTRAASLDIGPSRYELAPADAVDVRVRLDFDDARIESEARWNGSASDFVARIAPARTFAIARDLEELARRNLAHRAEPTSVVVVTPDAILCAGRPYTSDEPARHKLLDLLGDLYLFGGPFIGRFIAHRPGHAATHRALARALKEGIVR
jgi:UDP-3-O-[3-hydroxymyristoyl] N-acetylglucosamine deacetylase